jgi:crotonobetainyl-CoA:carnitine CoA-transferase CaiB-like acyl-CoA transferase
MIQGLGGLMSVTGERDDLAGGGPQKVGVAVSDLFTGMYATSAILAALLERGKSGRGSTSTWRSSTCRWRCSPT